jgi:hypothetical protein
MRRLLPLLSLVLCCLLACRARAGSLEDAVAAIPDPHAQGGWVHDGTGTLGPQIEAGAFPGSLWARLAGMPEELPPSSELGR